MVNTVFFAAGGREEWQGRKFYRSDCGYSGGPDGYTGHLLHSIVSGVGEPKQDAIRRQAHGRVLEAIPRDPTEYMPKEFND